MRGKTSGGRPSEKCGDRESYKERPAQDGDSGRDEVVRAREKNGRFVFSLREKGSDRAGGTRSRTGNGEKDSGQISQGRRSFSARLAGCRTPVHQDEKILEQLNIFYYLPSIVYF